MNARRLTILVCAAGLLLTLAGPAQAAKRVALVIGNAEYRHASRLANPLNDAADIGAALGRLGFEVARLDNAGYDAMRRGLRAFTRAAATSEIAVVFYAGHGIEVDGRNFLIPVDARLASDQDVEYEAVPLDLVSRSVDRASEFRLIVLDACRDNPFAKAITRSGATRSIGRGLARVEPAGETLVAYAARGGSVAADGEGRNSPYSTALLAHLEEPGLEVGLMFRKVRDAVLRSTGGRQEPFVYGSLSSEGVWLGPRPGPSAPAAKPARPGGGSGRLNAERVAAEAYKAAERLNTVEAFEAVARRFPGTVYADLARGHVRKLKGGGAQAALPPKPAPAPVPAKPASPADPAAAEAALGLTVADRSLIQWGLSAAGFDPGPADGAIGPATRAALRAWQAKTSRKATGYLTLASAGALKAAGEKASRAAGRPGKTFRDCPQCPVMVSLPTGSFTMGSPAHEEGRRDDEGPQHRVTIRRAFAVGKYEVTFAEWDACVAASVCSYRPSDEGWGRGHRPVINVSWHDAKEYVGWLSRRTGKRYRLLSEAEWEYAARAGTRTRYHWGNSVGRNRANCDRCGSRWDNDRTAPVGSFGANRFGLHDMHGNVAEWVEDCWHDNYRGAPSDGRARTSGGNNCLRVERSGSWYNSPKVLRSAFRFGDWTGKRNSGVGFRVARTLTP